jgi:glutamyl-tRNA reductase
MAIVVVGLNHRTAPISLLERLAIPEDRTAKALHHLLTFEHVLEGVVLSTCNRIEVYAIVSRFHGGAQDLRNFLAEFGHVAPEEFTDYLYTYHDDAAVRHLFRVAAGVDSMVVGESEILGQTKRAFQMSSDEGGVGRLLGHAFRQALAVGKRARSDTGIGRHPVSVSSAAVELARRAFLSGSLEGKRVLVVGAGKMGTLAVQSLGRAGATTVTVVSRTEERARDLAAAAGVAVRDLDDIQDAVASADIVICSTTSPGMVLERATVARAVARRTEGAVARRTEGAVARRTEDAVARRAEGAVARRKEGAVAAARGSAIEPLFIVDIAVPRDVDPSCAEVPGVVLRDIYDLRGVVQTGVGSRVAEVSKVEEIVAAEVGRFVRWERAGEIAPAIAAVVAHAEEMRRSEVARVGGPLRDLSPSQHEAIEQLTKRIVRKLLHRPLDVAKELAGSKQGYLHLQVLRELFELEDEQHP